MVLFKGDKEVNASDIEVIEAILKTMNSQISNSEICWQGCLALSRLTDEKGIQKKQLKYHSAIFSFVILEENVSKCGELGGIDTILNAIKAHIENTGVCEKACLALSNITLTSNENSIRLNSK